MSARRHISQRKSLVAVLGVALATGLVAASYALSQDRGPDLRANLPARLLPTVTLAPGAEAALAESIGDEARAAVGIVHESFANVRLLAVTPAGPLYLIPGTSGACLVLQRSASCGDPGAPEQPLLALIYSPDPTQPTVGGGITVDTVQAVSVESAGLTKNLGLVQGVFVVHPDDQVSRASEVYFKAR
jgi:hypothetical protein